MRSKRSKAWHRRTDPPRKAEIARARRLIERGWSRASFAEMTAAVLDVLRNGAKARAAGTVKFRRWPRLK